jgi:hypothetical protein
MSTVCQIWLENLLKINVKKTLLSWIQADNLLSRYAHNKIVLLFSSPVSVDKIVWLRG